MDKEAEQRERAKVRRKRHYAANKERTAAVNKAWRLKNRAKALRIQYVQHLQRTYGLTPEDKSAMRAVQGDACAICQEPFDKNERAGYVDHDHETGKVRGILCKYCNWGLGHFKDNPRLLDLAAIYLRSERT